MATIALVMAFAPSCTQPEPTAKPKAPAGDSAPRVPPPPASKRVAPPAIAAGQEYVVVSAEDSGQLSVIDAQTQALVSTFDVGRRPRGVKATRDGSCVFVALSGSPKCPPTISEEECAKKGKDASQDGIAQVDWRSQKVTRVFPGGSDPEQFDIIGPAKGCRGTRLFVANEDVGKLSVVDTESGKVIAEVQTGDEPEGVKVSPDGSIVVVASEEDSLLTFIDTETYKVVSSERVSRRPRDLVFSPSGDRLYVSAESGSRVDVINMTKRRLMGSIELPAGSLPMGLALSADGGTLFVATGRARKLLSIDLASKKVARSVEVGPRPWGIALSADGQHIYTANGPSDDVSIVDVKTFKVMKKIKVGESPWTAIVLSAP